MPASPRTTSAPPPSRRRSTSASRTADSCSRSISSGPATTGSAPLIARVWAQQAVQFSSGPGGSVLLEQPLGEKDLDDFLHVFHPRPVALELNPEPTTAVSRVSRLHPPRQSASR